LFNVVKFPNDVCSALVNSAYINGTCHTSDECKKLGGTESGSCAGGFGVCCSFTLACGGASSANNTYLVQSTATTLSACSYSICPMDSRVCRIRYDFTTHVLSNPVVGTNDAIGDMAQADAADAQGDCTKDGFSISGSGMSSPVICGVNTGQHMIIDSDGMECQSVSVYADSSTSTSRQWDIWVTQHLCADLEMSMAGPSGCLQYFTGKTGIVASYNFPLTTGPVIGGATTAAYQHLNNQNYKACIRRESDTSQICYMPIGLAGAAEIAQGTFGLSKSPDAAIVQGTVDTCTEDYVQFPGASNVNPATADTSGSVNRFCGRIFHTTNANIAHGSVCSLSTPFVIDVHFDANEITGDDNMASKALTNENSGSPGGSLGFALVFIQS